MKKENSKNRLCYVKNSVFKARKGFNYETYQKVYWNDVGVNNFKYS